MLFISSRPLFPIIGGDQIRTVQQLKFLLQKFEVDVYYISSIKGDEDILRKELPEIKGIYKFYSSRLRHYWQTLRFIFNNWPLQVNYYYDRRLDSLINSKIEEYDLVFCNNIRTAQYAINRRVKKCIDFVDAISMNYMEAKNKTKGIKKIIYSVDYKRCIDYEQKCLEKFDRCAIISEVDKQFILKCGK